MKAAQIQSWLRDGLTHHRAGRWPEAEKLYARVRQAAPASFDAWHLSGTLALQRGRLAEAREWLERALALKPASSPCRMRLGIVCQQVGDFATAERHLRAVVAAEPRLPEAWNHLAVTLRALGQRPEARAAYERAVALQPDYHEAHDRLGALVAECEGQAAAEPHFRRAVELAPHYAGGWGNLGVALVMQGRAAEADACFARALALEPTHAQALTGRALVRERAYRLDDALAAYADILTREPSNLEARSARLLALHYREGSAAELAEEHRAYGRALPAAPSPTWPERSAGENRLRVGFLSPDLRRHSVAYFLRPLLRGLDRTRFEVFLYHDHPQCDEVSRELETLADTWRHVAGLTASALEQVVRADAPDLLVDLAGHTAGNRLPLFARRLAPVQISYLGYPDTTGVPAMDYRLVDAVTDPVGPADERCTEKLVRFAPTAWVYEPPAEAPELVAPPAEASDAVTFGCFNNFAKITDTTLRAWAEILTAVPGARLLLKGHGLGESALVAEQNERLRRCGLDPAFAKFLERTPTTAAHLATYARVDVALDTFPYHGTTTTCEALWMGVPVVTLAGDRHASRVGVSLLRAIGREHWVAQDWPDYVARAVALANDAAGRSEWRREARAVLRRSPLLDGAGQAARFSEALIQCWQEHGQGTLAHT